MHAASDSGPAPLTPPGYRSLHLPSGCIAVAREGDADAVAAILAAGTIYDWASRCAERRAMHGRAVAWAVPLANGKRVVVRHSRHGGLLAPVTGDRFIHPTRAPHELAASIWLSASEVPTPAVVAYALYPAGPLLRTADVVVEEVEGARDLGEVAARGDEAFDSALGATVILLQRLGAAGAFHPDLNLKNILLSGDSMTPEAWVIDVDRVRRTSRSRAMDGNVGRLVRSLRKWRAVRGAPITDEHITRIAALEGVR